MMKKVLVVLAVLCCIGVSQADMVVDGATFFPTNGWVNNFHYADSSSWGSGWGIVDLRVTGVAGNLSLKTNIIATKTDGSDPYWVPGANRMESLSYTETYGLAGQNVTFNFVVGSNNLAGVLDTAGNPIVTEAFIKTLNAGADWATTQVVYEPLTVGAHSFTLYNIDTTLANPVVQVGFRVIAANDYIGSASGDLAVIIIPEPATMLLLTLGGLLISRKK